MLGYHAWPEGKKIAVEACIVGIAVLVFAMLEAVCMPSVSDILYVHEGQTMHGERMPVSLKLQRKGTTLAGTATIASTSLHGTRYRIDADDCLVTLTVNEIAIHQDPHCRLRKKVQHFELGRFLHEGKNVIGFTVKDVSGASIGFSIDPVANTPLALLLKLLEIFVPFGWLTLVMFRTIGPRSMGVATILFVGFIVRFLYVTSTPYTVRSYDSHEHVDYITYVAEHWTVPPATGGWEFHQPPLYYFTAAPLLTISDRMGHGKDVGIQWIQYQSLLLSCITLILAAWCAFLLFPRSHQRRQLMLFTALVTFFPGTLYFASRITNDVLFHLLAYAFLGCLLSWWKTADRRWLVSTSAVIGIGFLTKSNTYLFLPIYLICILFRPGDDIRTKGKRLLVVAGMVAIIAGWLIALRYAEHDFSRLFLRGDGMNPALRVERTAWSFLYFSPAVTTLMPYVFLTTLPNIRSYFWIYFFLSSLFGEAMFAAKGIILISRILVILGIGSVILAGIGTVKRLRANDENLAPLLVTFLVVIEAAISYAILHPSAPNQDFRFSLLILPILAYFAVWTTEGDTPPAVVARTWLLSFVACSILFFSAVFIYS